MILIKNGKILTMENEVYENGSILIEDGKIKKIGEGIHVGGDVEVIDANGKHAWTNPITLK